MRVPYALKRYFEEGGKFKARMKFLVKKPSESEFKESNARYKTLVFEKDGRQYEDIVKNKKKIEKKNGIAKYLGFVNFGRSELFTLDEINKLAKKANDLDDSQRQILKRYWYGGEYGDFNDILDKVANFDYDVIHSKEDLSKFININDLPEDCKKELNKLDNNLGFAYNIKQYLLDNDFEVLPYYSQAIILLHIDEDGEENGKD